MTFQSELAAAARGLARLAVHGTTTLTQHELDLALYARATLLDVAVRVHRDLAGPVAAVLHPRLSDLEADPVRTFHRALRTHQPVPARRAPSDVLALDPPTTAGRLWKDVARHSLQAHHLWQTGRVGRPDPDVAWAGLADVAAVASVVAELDGELATAARALPGCREHADKLAKATTSGLRTAAREVAALAAFGPLAATGPEPRPAPRRETIPVRSPQDAVAAQRQLAVLLRSARHLRPERVAIITIGHQRTLDAVLRTWRDQATPPVDPTLRGVIRDHVALLTAATGRRWGTASIQGGDPFPLHQAGLLRQALHLDGTVLRRLLTDPGATRAFLAAAADTTAALSEATEAHLRRGAWLRPTVEDGAFRWVPARSWHDVPRPTQALRAAGLHAAQLRAASDTERPDHTGIRSQVGRRAATARTQGPRHALAPAPRVPLLPHTLTARPLRPGIPPRPMAPTHVERQMRR